MTTKLCFFDDFFVAARPGVKRRYFQAKKLGNFEDPDALFQLYTSFFYDDRVNKYRLYYEKPLPQYNDTEVRTLMLAEGDSVEDFIAGNVTITQVEGISPEGVHGCGVFYNKEAKDDSHRYILCSNTHNVRRDGNMYFMMTSSDGINFGNLTHPNKVFNDSYCGMYYNPHNETYFCIRRPSTLDRRIATMRSKDLENWTTPEVILHPMPYKDMGMQYYSMGVNYVDGVFYALVWRYMTDLGQVNLVGMDGYMEVDLFYSYDGIHFVPTGLSPVAERPLPPDYGCKQLGLLNTCNDGNRTILCGIAARTPHALNTPLSNHKQKTFATAFYGIRKDGFCALEGFGMNSFVYTKGFLCEGGQLRVNYDARIGTLTAAVTDWSGKPLEGFSFEDCIPLTGESTDQVITWKNADLSSLAGQKIFIAFRLNSALLYTVSFEGRPMHDGPQVSIFDSRPLSEAQQ